jgi:hypothetical protein
MRVIQRLRQGDRFRHGRFGSSNLSEIPIASGQIAQASNRGRVDLFNQR